MTYWVGFRSFSLGETPTVPWRQRAAISDLRIAHGRASLCGERMGPRGRRTAEDQTITFRRRAPGKQDFWPIAAANGSEVPNRTVGGTAVNLEVLVMECQPRRAALIAATSIFFTFDFLRDGSRAEAARRGRPLRPASERLQRDTVKRHRPPEGESRRGADSRHSRKSQDGHGERETNLARHFALLFLLMRAALDCCHWSGATAAPVAGTIPSTDRRQGLTRS
jgi:hypothetical protein